MSQKLVTKAEIEDKVFAKREPTASGINTSTSSGLGISFEKKGNHG